MRAHIKAVFLKVKYFIGYFIGVFALLPLDLCTL